MLSLSLMSALKSCHRVYLTSKMGVYFVQCDLTDMPFEYDKFREEISRYMTEVKELLEGLGFELKAERLWGWKYEDEFGNRVNVVRMD